MKKMVLVGISIILLSNISFAYTGGDGSETSPYQISNLAGWQQLMGDTANWNKCFVLTADLNFGGMALTPVGNGSPYFTGSFDGQRHKITNFVINGGSNDNIGLFGYVQGGNIKNLGVENFTITGYGNVGGLVGYCNNSEIINCYADGSVSGTRECGGLVGSCWSSKITACYSKGVVSGQDSVGGLVGNGGYADIRNCYSTCDVSGNDGVGGLGGYMMSYRIVDCCYSVGTVRGNSNVGGCFGSSGYMGTCFWDVQTSLQTKSSGGRGLSTVTMQNEKIYLKALWDFKGEMENGTDDYWVMPEGGGYPILAWQVADSPVSNDEMAGAFAIICDSPISGTTTGAGGVDLTQNGYRDYADVWYYFDCLQTDNYTIKAESPNFNTTLGVFDAVQNEIVFNDDYFGGKSLVVLKAVAGKRYYIRIAGYDGQMGDFTLLLQQGAVQEIQGDLNYDGKVNLTDFSIFAGNWMGGL